MYSALLSALTVGAFGELNFLRLGVQLDKNCDPEQARLVYYDHASNVLAFSVLI